MRKNNLIESKKNIFLQKIQEKNGTCSLVGVYTKDGDIMEFRCNICGEIFKMRGCHVTQGHGCRKCKIESHVSTIRKTHEKFISEIKEKFGDEFIVKSKYITDSKPITVIHTICGKESTKKASTMLHHGGCKYCKLSKGEKVIFDFLNKNSIKFQREYRDKNCKYKYTLPFDFAIFDNNNDLECLIEYDGELHYKEGRWSDSFNKLQDLKHRDLIKNVFCDKNNIKLIRIPYWEFDNIEKILNHELRTLL